MTNYRIGNIVTGSITGIEKYGVFVNLDEYYKGLIHISEISNYYVRNINDFVNVGDIIKAKIVDVDNKTFHVNLSIKNIDYKIKNDNNNAINEVGSGFRILKNNLDRWILYKKKTKSDKI